MCTLKFVQFIECQIYTNTFFPESQVIQTPSNDWESLTGKSTREEAAVGQTYIWQKLVMYNTLITSPLCTSVRFILVGRLYLFSSAWMTLTFFTAHATSWPHEGAVHLCLPLHWALCWGENNLLRHLSLFEPHFSTLISSCLHPLILLKVSLSLNKINPWISEDTE